MHTRYRTTWRGKLVLQVGEEKMSRHESPAPGREKVIVWRDAKLTDFPNSTIPRYRRE